MTEAGDVAFVGAVGFADVGGPPLNTTDVVLDRMGDPLGERARFMLAGIQYPGDDPDCPDTLLADRFYLYRVSGAVKKE